MLLRKLTLERFFYQLQKVRLMIFVDFRTFAAQIFTRLFSRSLLRLSVMTFAMF